MRPNSSNPRFAMLLRSIILASALAIPAAEAAAQACVLVTDKPYQLTGVRRYYLGITGGKKDEKIVHFRRAVVQLVDSAGDIDNQLGRWYMLGKVYYAALLYVPDMKDLTTREDVGLVTNPKGSHDVFAAIDTAFTHVEELAPACKDSTITYRAGVYGTVYNRANAALKAQKYDSAEFLAKRALVAAPKSAAPWNIIAQARQNKGDSAGMEEALRVVVRVGKDDKTMASVRQQALYNLGAIELNRARVAPADKKKEHAAQAQEYFKEFLVGKADDPNAKSGLASASALMGDTAAVEQIFQSMLSDPAKYTAVQLIEAGTNAASAGRVDDAVKLMEAGLAKNPNYRTGLFNYSSALNRAKKFDKMIEVTRRLLAVDPSNTENAHQMAAAWQGLLISGTDDMKKAMLADSVAVDSIVFYLQKRDSAKVQVKFEVFQPARTGDALLQGVILNKSAAAKSYEITVEFLDATGAVVDTQKATVSDVAPNTAKQVRVTGKGQGIVAYRYKPVT